MKNCIPVRMIVVACVITALWTLHAEDTKAPLHNWERIWYPSLALSRDFQTLVVLEPSKDNGLQLKLSFDFPEKEMEFVKDKIPKTAIERLHLPDGTIIAGKFSGEPQLESIWHGTVEMALKCIFPWQRNVLEEAWLELRLGEHTYWLEIPYGFTRDPNAALTPVEIKEGIPKLAPAMKNLGDKDTILAWTRVDYPVSPKRMDPWNSEITVSARLSNSRAGYAELLLYKNSEKWDLRTPQSTLSISEDGVNHAGHCVCLRLLNGLFSRGDSYHFGEIISPARSWGSYTVIFNNDTYSFNAPSSMFHWCHGTAEPRHKALIREKMEW